MTTILDVIAETKKQNPDCLVAARIGDFYELFGNDATIAANTLGLTLTQRGKSDPTPMCGFTFHQLDAYLQRLVSKGYRVCIIDTNAA